jgi:hypothetical protein
MFLTSSRRSECDATRRALTLPRLQVFTHHPLPVPTSRHVTQPHPSTSFLFPGFPLSATAIASVLSTILSSRLASCSHRLLSPAHGRQMPHNLPRGELNSGFRSPACATTIVVRFGSDVGVLFTGLVPGRWILGWGYLVQPWLICG